MAIKAIAQFLGTVAQQRHMVAVRRGLSFNMPLIIIGSFAIVLNNLPLGWYQQAMLELFGPAWQVLGQAIWNGSFAVISILLVLSVSYFLAESHQLTQNGAIHPNMASLVSFSCLIAIMQPFDHTGISGLPVQWTGTHGLFVAILVALSATELFLRLSSNKKVNIVIFSDEADPTISQAMACIVPAAATIACFALLKLAAASLGIPDIHRHMYAWFENLFRYTQNGLGTALAFVGLIHSFWFFGLHGNNILEPVTQNLYVSAAETNMAVLAGGGQPVEIFTKPFFDSFVLIGGSGATLCLILALLLVSRRSNTLRLAKLSLLTAICNVNELLIFGLPIVMNPIYLVPFLLVPLVLTLVSYAATATGLIAVTITTISWTTPPLISGYMATGSWSGVVLQLVNICIGTMIYWPFVKLAEEQKSLETKHALADFFEQIGSEKEKAPATFINRKDSVGNLARILAHDLKKALEKNQLVLEYQPQVNSENRVFGLEALLRWPHEIYGRIPPPVIIAIAEEVGLIHEVGKWVIAHACRQLGVWNQAGIDNIRMSVNVSVMQVQSGSLVADIAAAIAANRLAPGDLEIEITESIALTLGAQTIATLEQVQELGARIAIDDFGKGYSSLQYIKTFSIDTLKIDRVLSIDVVADKGSQEIVASITALCSSLDIETVVECVETAAQCDKLRQLGCTQYQGYLYSPALPAPAATEYIRHHNLSPRDKKMPIIS
ncbi:MAG: EAL domain-containing protein [Negativicutes bacterium]|nr:EAL domain-containing protein [Negativicutes bacterium]